ncbi:MAG: nickel-responsive transcriptional regulator NikR [Endomicrobium sp.]|jgi:CopG family nickel-responsive transcriptional regulator|nr:nickel-responsive transcriptional regulator NikR [Endomicrobium sp.]
MSKLSRFGVSLNKDILDKFDRLINDQEYPTRSKAIEDLINYYITNDNLTNDKTLIIGTINLIYDHHKRELLKKLTGVQHDFQEIILSSQHIHVNHNVCFEMITVKGTKKEAERLFALIKGTKGIHNASLNMFSI